MFFRYPGGKQRIKNKILSYFPQGKKTFMAYIEPFLGGAAVAIEVIKYYFPKYIILNDMDPNLISLWRNVQSSPDKLIKKIEEYDPTVEDFYSFKEDLLKNKDANDIDIAFKKLVIHQISYSGLGTKAGGPIGGKKQTSQYGVDCRWNKKKLIKKIKEISPLLKNVDFKNLRWDLVISSYEEDLMYLDPPYFQQGENLYQEQFNDHNTMADFLKDCSAQWFLSYDDCQNVRDLYNWANIKEIPIKYTVDTRNGKKVEKNDLLIFS